MCRYGQPVAAGRRRIADENVTVLTDYVGCFGQFCDFGARRSLIAIDGCRRRTRGAADASECPNAVHRFTDSPSPCRRSAREFWQTRCRVTSTSTHRRQTAQNRNRRCCPATQPECIRWRGESGLAPAAPFQPGDRSDRSRRRTRSIRSSRGTSQTQAT